MSRQVTSRHMTKTDPSEIGGGGVEQGAQNTPQIFQAAQSAAVGQRDRSSLMFLMN
jgi:hypothetical protein